MAYAKIFLGRVKKKKDSLSAKLTLSVLSINECEADSECKECKADNEHKPQLPKTKKSFSLSLGLKFLPDFRYTVDLTDIFHHNSIEGQAEVFHIFTENFRLRDSGPPPYASNCNQNDCFKFSSA